MTKKTKNPLRPRCRKRAATRPLPQTNSGIDKPAKDSTMEEMTEVCLLLPRYIHGSLSLHLWVFVSYPCGFWWELTAGSESGDGKRNNVKVAPDNDWQSMLVRVYEFTQNPERAI